MNNNKQNLLLNTFPDFDDFLHSELQDDELRTIWVNDALKEYSDTKDVNQLVLRLKPLIEKDYTICEFAKKTGIHRVTLYKIFSYITVYYIMYLLALLNHDAFTEINIAFSCFSYLIVIAALEFLSDYLYFEQEEKGLNPDGILCSVPRISFAYSFFILAAVGLPVSSLFVNNFLIVSNLMSKNLNIGLLVVVSLTLVSGALLKNLYRLKDRERLNPDKPCIIDIKRKTYGFLIVIMLILLMSSFKPLWFLEM